MRTKIVIPRIAVLILALWVSTISAAELQARPAEWAAPVPSASLKNFYKLDEKVYRSAQPNRKGFEELKRLDIRNVLSFRDHHADDRDAKGLGLTLHRVKMEAGEIRDEQVVEALRIIRTAKGPIVVHCWHGSDRTGLISAMYRILYQNWSKEESIEELMKGGYGYHSLYRNIPEYIRKVDVESIRQRVLAP
ncbi:MAG: dual specificity protein phosphatase family protein [Nitrospirota bacterium]